MPDSKITVADLPKDRTGLPACVRRDDADITEADLAAYQRWLGCGYGTYPDTLATSRGNPTAAADDAPKTKPKRKIMPKKKEWKLK